MLRHEFLQKEGLMSSRDELPPPPLTVYRPLLLVEVTALDACCPAHPHSPTHPTYPSLSAKLPPILYDIFQTFDKI